MEEDILRDSHERGLVSPEFYDLSFSEVQSIVQTEDASILVERFPHLVSLKPGTISIEVDNWLDEHASAPWGRVFRHFAFESQDDAFHFKMRWL